MLNICLFKAKFHFGINLKENVDIQRNRNPCIFSNAVKESGILTNPDLKKVVASRPWFEEKVNFGELNEGVCFQLLHYYEQDSS